MHRYCSRGIDCSYVNGYLVESLFRMRESALLWGADTAGLLHMSMFILINKPTSILTNLSIRADLLRIKKIVQIFSEYQR